ncbi:unnamed protein product [Symbiodinium natans]|uniref:Uncharacterized protein n=1 Tax=Symbiodinium natans TaxID=878477 RepID=A0A812TTX4_9DINO|nr:unnamed protein product [Symbiodinium natans]
MKLQVGIFPHTAGGVCMTREALRRLSRHLEKLEKNAVTYPFPKQVGFWAPTVVHDKKVAHRVNGCGFVAGHWWDIMLGRCFVASNVTAHPAVEDEIGRYFFATEPLPCAKLGREAGLWQEHLAKRKLPPLPGPSIAPGSLENLANALCDVYGFEPELHRWMTCQPSEALDGFMEGDSIGRLLGLTLRYRPPRESKCGFCLRFILRGSFESLHEDIPALAGAWKATMDTSILYKSAECSWALTSRPKVARQHAQTSSTTVLCSEFSSSPLEHFDQAHATCPGVGTLVLCLRGLGSELWTAVAASGEAKHCKLHKLQGAVAAADPFEQRASASIFADNGSRTGAGGPSVDNFSSRKSAGDEPDRAIAITPPPGRPPEDRGPRVRRRAPGEDSARQTPEATERHTANKQDLSNEVQPFCNEEQVPSDASSQPLRSCLKGSPSPSVSRAEEATPPNSRGSSKEAQPKRSCLKQAAPPASPEAIPTHREVADSSPTRPESSSHRDADPSQFYKVFNEKIHDVLQHYTYDSSQVDSWKTDIVAACGDAVQGSGWRFQFECAIIPAAEELPAWSVPEAPEFDKEDDMLLVLENPSDTYKVRLTAIGKPEAPGAPPVQPSQPQQPPRPVQAGEEPGKLRHGDEEQAEEFKAAISFEACSMQRPASRQAYSG